VWNLRGSILERDVAMVAAVGCSESEVYLMSLWVRVMVFNATFNSTSVISWRSILLARTGVHGENHGPAVSHWQTLSHVMLYQVHLVWAGFELTTLVVIGTDCIDIYKSNYHTITTTTALMSLWGWILHQVRHLSVIRDVAQIDIHIRYNWNIFWKWR
jgi:hypothetical protein